MTTPYYVYALEPNEFLQHIKGKQPIAMLDFCPKISTNIIIDGKHYHIRSIHHTKQHIGVRAFTYQEDVQEEVTASHITCPYCGRVYDDADIHHDEGEMRCATCGSDMHYERIVEVSYVTTPQRKQDETHITR